MYFVLCDTDTFINHYSFIECIEVVKDIRLSFASNDDSSRRLLKTELPHRKDITYEKLGATADVLWSSKRSQYNW